MFFDRFFPRSYATFDDGGALRYMHPRDLAEMREHPEDYGEMWTGRIATALYGFSSVPGKEHAPTHVRHCSSGNRGPTGREEILIAFGNSLRMLVELGFIPCPSCHPEQSQGHWDVVGPTVGALYHLDSIAEFSDKYTLPFDPRRLSWETIAEMTGGLPSRIYIGPTMTAEEAWELHQRLGKIQTKIPPIGYYDRTALGRFRVVVPPTS